MLDRSIMMLKIPIIKENLQQGTRHIHRKFFFAVLKKLQRYQYYKSDYNHHILLGRDNDDKSGTL